MGTREEAQNALAQFLGCQPDELGEASGGSRAHNFSYNGEDGEAEYAVYEDYSDAEEDAKQFVLNDIEDMGLSAFSPEFQDMIISNGWLDTEWFETAMHESNESYAYDIQTEDASSDEYPNRLVEEAADRNLIYDEETDETGKFIGDEAELMERFIEDMDSDYSDPVEWYQDNFGNIEDVISQYNLMNEDEVAEECVAQDGPAAFIAHYDGAEEVEVYNGVTYYIYRMD